MKIIINQKEVSQERIEHWRSRESIKQLRYLIYSYLILTTRRF